MCCLQNNQSILFQHRCTWNGIFRDAWFIRLQYAFFSQKKACPAWKFKQILIYFLEITTHLCFESECSWYQKCVAQLAGRIHAHVCNEIPWAMCSFLQYAEKRQGCVLQEKDSYSAAKSNKSQFSINGNSVGGIGICQLLYPCWSLKSELQQFSSL